MTFILPPINIIGTILCSVSAFIFFKARFVDPVFFYYRLLCLVNILNLILNIPYGLLYSPRYFSKMNTYLSSLYLMYSSCATVFLFHFEDTLQIAILLTRMKTFSPFVRRHFSASPRLISFSLFLTCFLIDLPVVFSLKTLPFGTYFYFDSNGIKQIDTFYFYDSSEFSLTLIGKFLVIFTSIFLIFFLTLVVGVTLNIISVYQ